MAKLYIVPTPIGNLDDITIRAVRVLSEVDFILAEDTRTSSVLLKHLGIEKKMYAHHKFNEHATVGLVADNIAQGRSAALISDAGTPGISDPGFRKHNMSDNYSAGFGDQRQFRKIKRALPQTVYQIMFIMIGVLGIFECLFNQFINCGVIRRLFPSYVYHGCSFQLFCSTALRIWQPEKLDYCRPLII